MLRVVVAVGKIEPLPLKVEGESARGGVEGANAFWNCLFADAVAGNDRDAMYGHVLPPRTSYVRRGDAARWKAEASSEISRASGDCAR